MGSEAALVCSAVDELPSEWHAKRLGTFCTKIGTGATPRGGSEVYLNSRVGHALIRSQNVFDRSFDTEGLAFISDAHAQSLRNAEVLSGDVLLNITGDGVTFGRCCIVPENILPASVNQHVSIIRPDRRVCEPGYLLAVLTHPAIKRYIESFNSGGSRRAITKGHIESFEIPLPSLAEQKRIAHILGTLDDKIELNRRMNATLEAMARALFQSWFVDFDTVRAKMDGRKPVGMDEATANLFPDSFHDSSIGVIPHGWSVGTIEEATSLIIDHRGRTPKKLGGEWSHTGIPAISAKNVKAGRLVRPDTFNFVSKNLYDLWMKDKLARGDILMTSEAPLGELYYLTLDESYCLSQRIFAMRANPAVCESVYLYYWLGSPACQTDIINRGTGTTVEGIRQSELRRVQVLLPALAVQKAAVRYLGDWTEQIRRNEEQSRNLSTIRDSLLPKLICGELSLH